QQSLSASLIRSQLSKFSMKKSLGLLVLSLLIGYGSRAQTQELIQLDLSWEKALLTSDVDFLEKLLAEDFLWVHNHASLIDGKAEAVARAKRIQAGQANDTRGRTSRDHQVAILGQAAVVSGITVVDRGPSPVTYH